MTDNTKENPRKFRTKPKINIPDQTTKAQITAKVKAKVQVKAKAKVETKAKTSNPTKSVSSPKTPFNPQYPEIPPTIEETYIMPIYGVKMRLTKDNSFIYDSDCRTLMGKVNGSDIEWF